MKKTKQQDERYIQMPTSLLYNTQLSDKAVRIMFHILYRENLVKMKRLKSWNIYLTEISESLKGIPGYSVNAVRPAFKELVAVGLLKFVTKKHRLDYDHYELNKETLKEFMTRGAPENGRGGSRNQEGVATENGRGVATENGSLEKKSIKEEYQKEEYQKEEKKNFEMNNVNKQQLENEVRQLQTKLEKNEINFEFYQNQVKSLTEFYSDQKQSNGVRQDSPIDSVRPEPVEDLASGWEQFFPKEESSLPSVTAGNGQNEVKEENS